MSYPIKPLDIDTSRGIIRGFGHDKGGNEQACILVKFAQQRGKGWEDFTRKEIDEFFGGYFRFYSLTSQVGNRRPYILDKDGKYSFTHFFVANCFDECPVTKDITS